MPRNLIALSVTFFLQLFLLAGFLPAQERLKLGTGHKSLEVFYLPISAAEERGIWSANGVEIEWVPFAATGPLMKAMAAGHIKVGLSTALGIVPAVARGLPAVMVAEYQKALPFGFHVLTKSPVREVRDLKGLKVAISSRGGSTEMMARIMARAAGVEKDIRFVAVGGVKEQLAAVLAGIAESVMTGTGTYANLIVEGQLRTVGPLFGELPEGRMIGTAAFARKDFTQEGATTLSRLIKALAQASEFVVTSQVWSVEKVKSEKGYSQKTAEYAYKVYDFTGKVGIAGDRVERLRTALIEFDLFREKEMPRTAELFTNRFVP